MIWCCEAKEEADREVACVGQASRCTGYELEMQNSIGQWRAGSEGVEKQNKNSPEEARQAVYWIVSHCALQRSSALSQNYTKLLYQVRDTDTVWHTTSHEHHKYGRLPVEHMTWQMYRALWQAQALFLSCSLQGPCSRGSKGNLGGKPVSRTIPGPRTSFQLPKYSVCSHVRQAHLPMPKHTDTKYLIPN